eukprot:5916760-Pleurochrysis_carterae.AAC.1
MQPRMTRNVPLAGPQTHAHMHQDSMRASTSARGISRLTSYPSLAPRIERALHFSPEEVKCHNASPMRMHTFLLRCRTAGVHRVPHPRVMLSSTAILSVCASCARISRPRQKLQLSARYEAPPFHPASRTLFFHLIVISTSRVDPRFDDNSFRRPFAPDEISGLASLMHVCRARRCRSGCAICSSVRSRSSLAS